MTRSNIALTEGGGGKKQATEERTVASIVVQSPYVLLDEPALPTYSLTFENISAGTANDHIVQLMAPAGANVRVHRIVLWQEASTSGIAPVRYQVMRVTTAGTGGTAVTPRPFDTADTAGSTGMTLPSSKGTEGVILVPLLKIIRQALLTTASQDETPAEWQQTIGKKPIVIPAGTANGLVIKNTSSRTNATVTGYIEFTETAWL